MSNLHPIFDDILGRAQQFRDTDRAFDLLGQALTRPAMCRAVGQATQTHNVVCQLEAHPEGTYHEAHVPGIGHVQWRDVPRIGRHLAEVESGVCDPDDEHDRAKETREDPL